MFAPLCYSILLSLYIFLIKNLLKIKKQSGTLSNLKYNSRILFLYKKFTFISSNNINENLSNQILNIFIFLKTNRSKSHARILLSLPQLNQTCSLINLILYFKQSNLDS